MEKLCNHLKIEKLRNNITCIYQPQHNPRLTTTIVVCERLGDNLYGNIKIVNSQGYFYRAKCIAHINEKMTLEQLKTKVIEKYITLEPQEPHILMNLFMGEPFGQVTYELQSMVTFLNKSPKEKEVEFFLEKLNKTVGVTKDQLIQMPRWQMHLLGNPSPQKKEYNPENYLHEEPWSPEQQDKEELEILQRGDDMYVEI